MAEKKQQSSVETEPKTHSKGVKAIRYAAVGFISLLAVVALTMFIGSVMSGQSGKSKSGSYELADDSWEAVVVSDFRLAIAQSALDGKGSVNAADCSILESITKNYDSDARWFSDCAYITTGSTPDTNSEKILKLSDGDYCATYTFDEEITVLMNYTFTEGSCGDSRITVM